MKVEDKELFRVLIPDEGLHIKHKKSGNIAEYIVYLSKDEDISNYKEVSEEEYQKYITNL